MSYIANRPLNIGGHDYFIGDEIPEKDVMNPSALLAAQLITEANPVLAGGQQPAGGADPAKVSAPVLSKSGISRIDLTVEEAETALLFLQLPAEEAVKTAEAMKAGPLTEYLKSVEKRKKVQEALGAVATEQSPEDPGEDSGSNAPEGKDHDGE